MIPKDWSLIVIDLKDCFFSIPLNPQDRQRFAFTVPTTHHEGPDKRFEWKVLPQGMTNSTTLCQFYVSQAIEPVRLQHQGVRIFHYMDDILLTAANNMELEKAFATLTLCLHKAGLQIAPEKIQKETVVQYLGLKLTPISMAPLEFTIATSGLRTLNDSSKIMQKSKMDTALL